MLCQICAQLDHPSIVHLEAVYRTEKSLLLVMEYLPGGDLFDGIVSRKQYSEKDACACTRQILLALVYLSKNGILHRVNSALYLRDNTIFTIILERNRGRGRKEWGRGRKEWGKGEGRN